MLPKARPSDLVFTVHAYIGAHSYIISTSRIIFLRSRHARRVETDSNHKIKKGPFYLYNANNYKCNCHYPFCCRGEFKRGIFLSLGLARTKPCKKGNKAINVLLDILPRGCLHKYTDRPGRNIQMDNPCVRIVRSAVSVRECGCKQY